MAQIYRGYKYRLYPDSEARAYFTRCFGAMRYCYNFCVREYKAAAAAGVELGGYDVAARLREHTKDLKWMAGVDYYIKEFAPKRFDNALSRYKRFLADKPREHKKGDRPSVSYTTDGETIKVDFKHDLVQLPKIGIVRARLHRTFSGEITSATIKREADGNYYISLNVRSEAPAVAKKPHTDEGTVGVDVGLRHLATLSTGDFFDLPDMSRSVARINFLKKRLERQKPGSKRYWRTKLQIARLYHREANITRDAHHKAAVSLCRDFDTICMETLNVKGMKKGQVGAMTADDIVFNASLHRSALALLIDRVKQKADDTGTNFVSIDRWEPTTKTCHVCGHVLDSIDLNTKAWTCPECGTHHDRDVNAAINIRRKGIEQLQTQPPAAATTEKLPLAGGNVKTVKIATPCCDLRTVRKGGHSRRPPKDKIADGTAPPRIFNNPPLAPDHPFRFFKFSTLGKMVGASYANVMVWVEESRFINPREKDRELTFNLLYAIKSVAANLRQLRIADNAHAHTYSILGKMNKVARIDWILKEKFHYECPFTEWRQKKFSETMIAEINQLATVDFPNRLDAMADKYLHDLNFLKC